MALLAELWSTKLSASKIGKKLGVSRNAVVGKAGRMRLPHRPSPIKKAEIKSAKPLPKKRKTLDVAEDYVPANPSQPTACQYPVGDHLGPDEWRCIKPLKDPEGSYCAEHHAICYQTPETAE